MSRTPSDVLVEYSLLRDRLTDLTHRWRCDNDNCDGLPHEGWLHHHARSGQREPADYDTWLLMTGRGFGKTRTGAETVKGWGLSKPRKHYAIIAKNDRECRNICFEGPAGLLSVIPPSEIAMYKPTPGETRLYLTNGTVYRGFSAESPDNLRGYAFDGGWCDEFAAWHHLTAQTTYDMLWFCLREAAEPKVIVTTTPKPLMHVRNLLKNPNRPGLIVTKGSMQDNLPNLSEVAVTELTAKYSGTRLGRQELSGELLDDVEDALWKLSDIDDARVAEAPQLVRIVVAIDPAVTSGEDSDETGIVAVGKGEDGHAYVLADRTCRDTPLGWAKRAVGLFEELGSIGTIVGEANQGGDMIETTIRAVSPTVPYKKVHAKEGKRLRAEPIAALYEQGRVHHVGAFDKLEDQMTGWVPDLGYSPDRLDALVHGIAELNLAKGSSADRFFSSLAPSCSTCGTPMAYDASVCSVCGAIRST